MRTLQNLFLDRDGQDDVKVLFGEERKKKVDAHTVYMYNVFRPVDGHLQQDTAGMFSKKRIQWNLKLH